MKNIMDTKKGTNYYAVTKMGKFIAAKSFEELQDTLKKQDEKDIELYVAFMYDKPYITQQGTEYWWPQIQIIDKQKQPTTYQRGMFKVKHIYPDIGSYYFKGRQIVFENCITHESIERVAESTQDPQFVTIADFYNSLIDIMDELNRNACEQLMKQQNKSSFNN